MAGLELTFRLARSAEGFYELAVFIELEHIVRPVAIGDENRTIRRDGDGAGVEPFLVLVDSRLRRIMNRPKLLAVELELDDFVIRWPRGVNELPTFFRADFQRVDARRPQGTQELALGRKDHNATLGIGGNINIALLVQHHAAMAGPQRFVAGILLEEIGHAGILQLGGKCGGGDYGDQSEQGLGKAIHNWLLLGRGFNCLRGMVKATLAVCNRGNARRADFSNRRGGLTGGDPGVQ